MATTLLDKTTAAEALDAIEELITHQRKRVLEYAKRIRPGLTDEDLRNVHEFPEVYNDPGFQFEDGQLAGFVAAKIALKSRLLGGTLPS